MKDRSNIRPIWLLAAITIPVIVTGLICSLIYDNRSMFFFSLIGAALMVVVFPLVVCLSSLVHNTPSVGLRFIDFLRRLFTIRR